MTSADAAHDDRCAQQLRAELVTCLVENGYLTESWRPMFERVPRHWFIPRVFASTSDGRYAPLDGLINRTEWLRHVYSNELCTTQLNGDNTAWEVAKAAGSVAGVQTCTSTEPGLMACMLDELDVQDGHRVLEIGTGTGYNAALLCERLGDDKVTTVDVDASLVDEARDRLAAVGHNPTVVTGDGREGYPPGAPYDRIIATCSLPYLPYAWVQQARPAGRVILNVAGTLGGAMLLIRPTDRGSAEGRFLPRWAGFLPARGAPGVGDISPRDTADGAYETHTTRVSPRVLDDPAFAFLAWLATQDARLYWADLQDGRQLTCLIGLDGSWCEVYPTEVGERQVDQGGPRRLWRLVEDAHEFWRDHHRPDWAYFGVTITPEKQSVWFEDPTQETAWSLPGPTEA